MRPETLRLKVVHGVSLQNVEQGLIGAYVLTNYMRLGSVDACVPSLGLHTKAHSGGSRFLPL